MSELIFVRHGQASFGKESYDKLSDNGIEQVKLLARHWQSLGQEFDFIYSGDLLRQVETATELFPLVKGAAEKHRINPAFNEYNGDPLMQIYLRDHAVNEGFDADLGWPIREEKVFQKLFEAATAKWLTNDLTPSAEDHKFEAWTDFQTRVYRAIDELIRLHTNGAKVLVSTSGGVIAMALQKVLQFPDEQVIATNWMVHNSSVSRIRYGNGKLSLTQFNSIAHLEEAELHHRITYR